VPGCPGLSPGAQGPAPAPAQGRGGSSALLGGIFSRGSQQAGSPVSCEVCSSPPTPAPLCLVPRPSRLPSGGSRKLFSGFSLPTVAPPVPSCSSAAGSPVAPGQTPAPQRETQPRRPGSSSSSGHEAPRMLLSWEDLDSFHGGGMSTRCAQPRSCWGLLGWK